MLICIKLSSLLRRILAATMPGLRLEVEKALRRGF